MSYFEYVFSGVLTPEFEEKTNEIYKQTTENFVPFSIHKYTDEVFSEDKKKRTLVIYSQLNMREYLFNKFSGSGLEMRMYLKQEII